MADKDPAARAAARILIDLDDRGHLRSMRESTVRMLRETLSQFIRDECAGSHAANEAIDEALAKATERNCKLSRFVARFSSDTTGNTPRRHAP